MKIIHVIISALLLQEIDSEKRRGTQWQKTKKWLNKKTKPYRTNTKIGRSASPASIMSIKPFEPSEAQKFQTSLQTKSKSYEKKTGLRAKKLRRLRRLEKHKRKQKNKELMTTVALSVASTVAVTVASKVAETVAPTLSTTNLPKIEFQQRKYNHPQSKNKISLNDLPNKDTCGRPTVKFTEGLFTENIPILRKKRDTYDPRDPSWFDDENTRDLLSDPRSNPLTDPLADPLSESWGANNGARIVGGTQAAAHSWPWAVLLTVCIEYGWARECFKCGAVLISRKWALTAGHCLPKNRKLSIVADIGNHDSSIDNQGVKVVVEDYMVHEGFKKLVSDGVAVIEHDVGLIKLAREVDYDDKIRSACLPNEHVCIKPGTICVVVGWGYRVALLRCRI